jgi:guanylate kinase
VHYQFKSQREFERMRDSEALLEWAEVHGNCLWHATREAAEISHGRGPRHAV